MNDKKQFLIDIIIILALFFLAYLFIYSGDDWAWGSSLGMEKLSNFFYNYNGRYLGNICVLVLTRNRIRRAIVMTICLFSIIKLINKIVNKNNNYLTYLSLLLLLVIPKFMFREALAWTSGFTNYVIPVVLLLLYYYNYNNHKDNKLNLFLVFILGISISLFMEHITIYSLILSIFILIRDYMKQKKISLYNISYFLGSLTGSIIMFTNKAYYSISKGVDTYRTAPQGLIGKGKNAINAYFETIYKRLVLDNMFLILILVILLVLVVTLYLKNKSNNKSKLISISNLIIITYSIYQIIHFTNLDWQIIGEFTVYFEGIFTALFFLSIFIITFITISNKKIKEKLIFYLISIVVLTLPLLLVIPIGPRCFFPMYVLFILYIMTLIDYLENKKIIKITKNIKKLTIYLIGIFYIYLISIYSFIYIEDINRLNYINKEIEKGNKTIEIKKLPYQNYIWIGEPKGNLLEERYKLFYNIDKDIKIIVKDK